MSFNIQPIKAYLTRNTQVVTEMDPYVEFRLGKQFQKTSIIKEGGRKPEWKDKITMKFEQDNTLNVKVMDEDEVTDDVVGEGSINLNLFKSEQGPTEKYVSLKFDKKPAGKILLRVQVIGKNPNQSSQPQVTKQPTTIMNPMVQSQFQTMGTFKANSKYPNPPSYQAKD